MPRGAHPPGRAREIAVLVIGVTNREQPQPVVDDNATSLSAATVDSHVSTTKLRHGQICGREARAKLSREAIPQYGTSLSLSGIFSGDTLPSFP